MDWIKKLKKTTVEQLPPPTIAPDSAIICLDAYKSHWLQICEVINSTSLRPAFIQTDQTKVTTVNNVSFDDVDAVRTLLEQMTYLLIEEQSSGQVLGPILEYTITQEIFQKLANWWENLTEYKEQIMLNLLKIYEVLISQAQHALLHHKQLVSPMLKILSSSYRSKSEELDGHIVLLLNLLCVWMNRDPTLLEVFFNPSSNHGPASFLVFSLLIEYIHREGTVGQQARDALLLCMALSAENETVAHYIVDASNFCPVLATGLSALYSTLPRHMEVRADDWHCLQKSDWSAVPELTNFMNSFEFCNSVVEVSHRVVSEQLLEYFYNGFLVSVFGPSLHKTSADEVVVTAAYLNLFLRSVTAPALMRMFLQFLLTHRHDNSLIINTLIQRIASSSRLALVSLSLIRTLIDLNCEDLMLQLVFRYLIPCQHILASQRRAIRDVDIYNASASRFLALTPAPCTLDDSGKEEDLLAPVNDATPDPTVSKSPSSNETQNDAQSHTGNDAFHHLAPPPPVHAPSPAHPPFFRKSSDSGMPHAPSAINHATSAFTVNEDLSVTISLHPATPSGQTLEMATARPRTITNVNTMAEFGPDLSSQLELNTSYMDYLEDARNSIDQCREACSSWSSPYDGIDPINVGSGDAGQKEKEDGKEEESANGVVERNGIVTSIADGLSNTTTSFLQTSTTDTAMKALTATYQTLNFTALALNQRPDDNGARCEKANPPESSNSDPGDDGIEVANAEPRSDDVPVNGTRTAEDDSGSSQSTEQPKLTGSVADDDGSVPASGDADAEGRHRTSTVGNSSSVDEFFRSLMEIVPPTTRDKIGKEPKSGTTRPDEDIESGIEISSDGDNPIREVNLAPNVGDRDEEDAPSRLSSNGDEIANDVDMFAAATFAKFRSNELTTLNRTYSFADDTDTEFDDTVSIASSSFYEANDEYSPTEISVAPSFPLKVHGIPYTGPLIGNLFAKLDMMISNSLYENLLLTGIVARLAVYPQPLLRSFLLNTHMVFHPSVKSLYQVLNNARIKIDSYAAEVPDFKVLIRRAQKYLLARGTYPFSSDARNRNNIQDKPMPVPKVKSRMLSGMFKRRKAKETSKKKPIFPPLETLLERRSRSSSKGTEEEESGKEQFEKRSESTSSSMFYVKQQTQQRESEERKLRELRTKNAVYASIVLAEFLKELAAIAQEHAVASIAR